jgi:paraquat-inducible protein A
MTDNAAPISARRLGLHACHECDLVSEVRGPIEHARCPRCNAPLNRQAAVRLQRSMAWLAAAAVLYVPANVLPVMATADVLHGSERHTILGGIVELFGAGEWALALIVFIASIVVPLLKMVALSLLTFSARRATRWRQPERTRLYRLVEAVGHWSMLDVLVVVLLVAMVRFGALASVQAEPGLLAFGAVVVLTMLASEAFDPRLIWDRRPDDGPDDGPDA